MSALISAVVLTYMTVTAPGWRACQAGSSSGVIESASEQPASRSGIRTCLSGREDGGGLGHEVHAAEGDDARVGSRGLAGEAEGVADVVRDVLDLGHLVVVGQDDGVALAASARTSAWSAGMDSSDRRLMAGTIGGGAVRQSASSSRDRSRAGAEWVSAPTR